MSHLLHAVEDAYSPEDQLALDILQAQSLRSIFNSKLGEGLGARLAVKGGIAMQATGASRRWTSDIDFAADPLVFSETTSRATISRRMDKLMQSIGQYAEQSGLLRNAKVVMAKNGAATMRWKISGEGQNGSRISMKVEVSGRDNLADDLIDECKFVPHHDPQNGGSFMVRSYTPMVLAASKIGGMISGEDGSPNHRIKARDVYDLYMLMTEVEVEPPIELLAALGQKRLDTALEEVMHKIDQMDYSYVVSGLLPYLPEDKSAVLTEELWEKMRIEVALTVEDWIKSAREIAPENYIPRDQVGTWMNERRKFAP
jgi:predicted nucleotidyltransferase component of viral defense system